MKYKLLCILCLSCTLLTNVAGQDTEKTNNTPPDISLQTQLMDQQISELIAGRVIDYKGIVVEELASIDESLVAALLEYESLMYPADELYGSWDTKWVNPYRSKEIAYPDSFSVDCRSFVLPIDVGIKVTSNFGIRARRMHNGIDLKVQKGDTIRSAFSGKVRIKGYERTGYGYYLVIRHSNGLETVYGHLSAFLVAENDIVMAGQPIGLGGNTGRSTGTHLHFETRFLGQALNPSHIIDFNNGGVPHNDYYVLANGKFGNNTNVYTSTSERIVYHRVQKGETLSKIAVQYRTTVAELCRLNGLTTKSVLRIGQSIRCGTTIAKAENKNEVEETVVAATTPETPVQIAATEPDVQAEESIKIVTENAGIHLVQKGESLFSISQQYKTTIAELCRLNGITEKTTLQIGQKILYNSSQQASPTVASASEATQKAVAEPVYYRIKEGDTLSAIALKHGITINQLCELNNITRTTILRIGRTLRCS